MARTLSNTFESCLPLLRTLDRKDYGMRPVTTPEPLPPFVCHEMLETCFYLGVAKLPASTRRTYLVNIMILKGHQIIFILHPLVH